MKPNQTEKKMPEVNTKYILHSKHEECLRVLEQLVGKLRAYHIQFGKPSEGSAMRHKAYDDIMNFAQDTAEQYLKTIA
jgi:hypothetical protein